MSFPSASKKQNSKRDISFSVQSVKPDDLKKKKVFPSHANFHYRSCHKQAPNICLPRELELVKVQNWYLSPAFTDTFDLLK